MSALPAAMGGALTALVTPFNRDGSVDLAALDALVDAQLAAGIAGVVPCGSTGEAATLSVAEHSQVVARVAARVAGRVPVIAGTGHAGTAATLAAQARARDDGADCGLVVTPPYVRPTQAGLYAHYAAIAAAGALPFIAYNVPARTGSDLHTDTAARVLALPGCRGLKDATGSLPRLAALRAAAPRACLLSGDDATCCAFALLGGDGAISVAANAAPAALTRLLAAAARGDGAAARTENDALMPLFAALAGAPNPLAIKEALALQGRLQPAWRLPLAALPEPERTALQTALRPALAAAGVPAAG